MCDLLEYDEPARSAGPVDAELTEAVRLKRKNMNKIVSVSLFYYYHEEGEKDKLILAYRNPRSKLRVILGAP